MTLQEFFAAEALVNDEQGLLERFRGDPDGWREVVKLWCGLGINCTALVRGVRETDPMAAFECLADAQQVDAELV